MKQKILIESLAMDLLRMAVGLQRGSIKMADRFREEALKREEELKSENINQYLKILIQKSELVLKSNSDRAAEDALMYSTLFQNFAKTYKF